MNTESDIDTSGFYIFYQNDCFGSFVIDTLKGITHCLLIEASSVQQAYDRAIEIGLYFGGVSKGIDSNSCGDRWAFEPFDNSFVKSVEEWQDLLIQDMTTLSYKLRSEHVYSVHFLDGTIQKFIVQSTEKKGTKSSRLKSKDRFAIQYLN
jgi:hypothetical protein